MFLLSLNLILILQVITFLKNQDIWLSSIRLPKKIGSKTSQFLKKNSTSDNLFEKSGYMVETKKRT